MDDVSGTYRYNPADTGIAKAQAGLPSYLKPQENVTSAVGGIGNVIKALMAGQQQQGMRPQPAPGQPMNIQPPIQMASNGPLGVVPPGYDPNVTSGLY